MASRHCNPIGPIIANRLVQSAWTLQPLRSYSRAHEEAIMSTISLPFPELIAIAATRGLLGVGIGLLLSEHLNDQQRHTAGWTLIAFGALSTIPLAYDVLSRRRGIAVRATSPDFAGVG